MDYEKLYKEMKARVLEIGRGYVNGVDFSKPRQIAEYIDPELKESEDERIVKFIKNQLFNIKKTITENYELDAKLTKAIDWLEKQDEHELVESMECSSKTTNVEFFQWIYDRLKHVYNENPNVDFMRSLKERIEGMKNPSCSEEDERIRKDIVAAVETYGDFTQDRKEEIYAWLKKQDECKLLNKKIRGKDELFDHRYAQYLVEAMHQPYMIQWKGDNLKEVIDFTGKSENFDEWFPSFEEFERYVHEHNNIFKLFNEDGSHFEIPVGAWIVKTPDGYNVASKAIFKNKPSCSEEYDRIKSCIGICLSDATEQRFKEFNTTLKDCIAWLKKQGEQKTEIEYVYPKFRIGDVIEPIKPNGFYTPVRVLSIEKKTKSYYCESDDHKHYSSIPIRCENEYKLVEQKPAWSEEDEHCIELLLPIIDSSSLIPKNRKKCKEFLKSIKPNHWKPSEEQMYILEWLTTNVLDDGAVGKKAKEVLSTLIEQLKSL